MQAAAGRDVSEGLDSGSGQAVQVQDVEVVQETLFIALVQKVVPASEDNQYISKRKVVYGVHEPWERSPSVSVGDDSPQLLLASL